MQHCVAIPRSLAEDQVVPDSPHTTANPCGAFASSKWTSTSHGWPAAISAASPETAPAQTSAPVLLPSLLPSLVFGRLVTVWIPEPPVVTPLVDASVVVEPASVVEEVVSSGPTGCGHPSAVAASAAQLHRVQTAVFTAATIGARARRRKPRPSCPIGQPRAPARARGSHPDPLATTVGAPQLE